MSQRVLGVNGMHDIVPDPRVPAFRQSHHWTRLLDIFSRTAALYGFNYIETPEVERTSLFVRSVGQSSDIVSKEMYVWDQNGRDLCLRPEGSAAVARAVIDADLASAGEARLWYRMSMFRHERSQFGRYRRHVQHGAEIIGVAAATADVEVIKFLWDYYRACDLRGFSLHINSIGDEMCRPAYVAELRTLLAARASEYCTDCQHRIEHNPLRVFDCKVPADRERNQTLPRIVNRLCEPCQRHFDDLRAGLTVVGLSYVEDPDLVRGLDYYTRTAFEIMLDEPLEQMATLTGGGRYDGLYQMLGGSPLPAVGFGAGVERLLLALEHQNALEPQRGPWVSVLAAAPEVAPHLLAVAARLRDAGVPAVFDSQQRRLGKALSSAVERGTRYAVILAPEEWGNGQVLLKDLAANEQRTVKLDELVGLLGAPR